MSTLSSKETSTLAKSKISERKRERGNMIIVSMTWIYYLSVSLTTMTRCQTSHQLYSRGCPTEGKTSTDKVLFASNIIIVVMAYQRGSNSASITYIQASCPEISQNNVAVAAQLCFRPYRQYLRFLSRMNGWILAALLLSNIFLKYKCLNGNNNSATLSEPQMLYGQNICIQIGQMCTCVFVWEILPFM